MAFTPVKKKTPFDDAESGVTNEDPNKSSRISAKICIDVPVREKLRPGARQYWAYGYKHLCHLFQRSNGVMRMWSFQHRFAMNSLASIIVFAASDPEVLAHCRKIAEECMRKKIVAAALKPSSNKRPPDPSEVRHSMSFSKVRGRKKKK